MPTEFKYEVVEHIATLSTSAKGWTKELNLISWNDREPKYDIREWSPNKEKMGKGVTLSDDEVVILRKALDSRDDIKERIRMEAEQGQERRFCTQCGALLEPGASFCAACGANVSDMESATATTTAAPRTSTGGGDRASVGILILIWSLFALFYGAYCVMFSEAIVDTMVDMLEENGYDLDTTGLSDSLVIEGASLVLSGVFGLMSTFLVLKGIMYKVAFFCLVGCTITSWPFFLTVIVGILVTLMLQRRRGSFSSRSYPRSTAGADE